MALKDSGSRREFESGAVRDIQTGKGRCDLLPLDTIATILSGDIILSNINSYVRTGYPVFLRNAIETFAAKRYGNCYTAILEVSKHYEEGCDKYGERNWEKGIPLHCYIDSGIRHYLKWLNEENDEPHDRAFLWNMLGALWTQSHLPEQCDLPFNEEEM